MKRPDFLKVSATSLGAAGVSATPTATTAASFGSVKPARTRGKSKYSGEYSGTRLSRIAFPMGGMGAGMICLEGTGALSHVSLRHKPDIHHEPQMFAALHVKGAKTARVLEGPTPMWKAFGSLTGEPGNGLIGRTYGLPRFANATFAARFPFATVKLTDQTMPVAVEVTGWSPFTPGATDDSCLPVAAVEYRITNRSTKPVKAVFSFHAANFMKVGDGADVGVMPGGFVLRQGGLPDKPAAAGAFAAFTEEAARVDAAWFRGGWFDALTMVWKHVAAGDCVEQAPQAGGTGGSLYVPVTLKAKASQTVRLLFAWHVPQSDVRAGKDVTDSYSPWYASQYADVAVVAEYWRTNYDRLRSASATFRDCYYDTTLPAEVVESVAANLAILKSPTCLRQADGRLWGWEGCHSGSGCCHGTCTHVWNYAQAIPHLFPDLERTLRETEFKVSQDERGHQNFRSSLPIIQPDHGFHAAADGQLGGLMKLYREWRISGDTEWLQRLWPAAKRSLDYCIATWDPDQTGTLVEPHHNTYDIEFWGADGMCTSFYAGALAAAVAMGRACDADVTLYETLLAKSRRAMATTLWNGEYFIQQVQWTGLRAGDPQKNVSWSVNYSAEAAALLQQEGPKYQYGNGCLSDGVLGDWIARCCGLGAVVDEKKTARHLASVFQHNFRESLTDHANPQRPGYALPQEGGLLLCSWPKGGKPALPFVYSDEVWTGIEYQVAAHLMMTGQVKEGLEIVRAVRQRYDGRWRNPFDEYECGHWYARAMASYGMLQALSGARYDAVEKTLYLQQTIKGDFRAFLCTATGYGTVGVRKGKPFCEVKSGRIDIQRIAWKTDKSAKRE